MTLTPNWLMRLCILVLLAFSVSAKGGADVFDVTTITGKPTMNCFPMELKSHTVFRVDFPKSHGSDFAIIRPSGDYLFLVFLQPDANSPLQPVISETQFAKMHRYKKETSKAMGINWSTEINTPVSIFSEIGEYTVVVGTELESEDPNIMGWCKFKYTDTR